MPVKAVCVAGPAAVEPAGPDWERREIRERKEQVGPPVGGGRPSSQWAGLLARPGLSVPEPQAVAWPITHCHPHFSRLLPRVALDCEEQETEIFPFVDADRCCQSVNISSSDRQQRGVIIAVVQAAISRLRNKLAS